MTQPNHNYTDDEIKAMFENASDKLERLFPKGSKEYPDAKSVVLGLLRGELAPGSELDPTIDRYGTRIVGYKITLPNIRSTRMKNESILDSEQPAQENKSQPSPKPLYTGDNASATILFRQGNGVTRVDVSVKVNRYEDKLNFAYKVPGEQTTADRMRLVESLKSGVVLLEASAAFSTTFSTDESGNRFVEFNSARYNEAVDEAGLADVLPKLEDMKAPMHLVKTEGLRNMLCKLSDARATLVGLRSGKNAQYTIERKDGSKVSFFSTSEPKPEGDFLYLPKDAHGTDAYMIPASDVFMVHRAKADVEPIIDTLYA